MTTRTVSAVNWDSRSRPAPLTLTPADLGLLAAGDTAGLLARYPAYRGWRVVIRGGHCEPTRRQRTAIPRDRKVVLPARPGESEWDALLRLMAQGAMNRCVVTPLSEDLTIFSVSSQDPGNRDTYTVWIAAHAGADCDCPHGRIRRGGACAHIAAVYAWLLRQRRPRPDADDGWDDLGTDADPPPGGIRARGTQAAADLWGAA